MPIADLKPTSDRFWTVSNVVSMVRIVLTVPVAWAIAVDESWLAFSLCWFAAFTDWLDGTVARATKTVSEWGKVIDPIADKVLVGVIVVMLLVKGLLPMWFVVAVIVRDVVIVVGGLYAQRFTRTVLPSKWSGKLAVSFIALTGVAAMVQWMEVRDWSMAVSCFFIALSLWDYSRRLHGIVRQDQENLQ